MDKEFEFETHKLPKLKPKIRIMQDNDSVRLGDAMAVLEAYREAEEAMDKCENCFAYTAPCMECIDRLKAARKLREEFEKGEGME